MTRDTKGGFGDTGHGRLQWNLTPLMPLGQASPTGLVGTADHPPPLSASDLETDASADRPRKWRTEGDLQGGQHTPDE